jgi:hypothetical protein
MTTPVPRNGSPALKRPTKTIVWHPNSCGWHVYLLSYDGTMAGRLKPTVMHKMCLRYQSVPVYATTAELLGHISAALALEHDYPIPTCNRL